MVRTIKNVLVGLGCLGFLTVSLAGGADRVLWVNDDKARSYGSMSSSLIEDRLNVELPSRCRYSEPQHVEFKLLQEDVLQIRCSWFEGGGLTWWPFYSEVHSSHESTLAAFHSLFQTGGGHE